MFASEPNNFPQPSLHITWEQPTNKWFSKLSMQMASQKRMGYSPVFILTLVAWWPSVVLKNRLLLAELAPRPPLWDNAAVTHFHILSFVLNCNTGPIDRQISQVNIWRILTANDLWSMKANLKTSGYTKPLQMRNPAVDTAGVNKAFVTYSPKEICV